MLRVSAAWALPLPNADAAATDAVDTRKSRLVSFVMSPLLG
jgi:hypothetical protein